MKATITSRAPQRQDTTVPRRGTEAASSSDSAYASKTRAPRRKRETQQASCLFERLLLGPGSGVGT